MMLFGPTKSAATALASEASAVVKVDVSKAVSRPLVPSKVCCVTSFWSLVFAGVVESLSLES
jgi:hypothetical protein